MNKNIFTSIILLILSVAGVSAQVVIAAGDLPKPTSKYLYNLYDDPNPDHIDFKKVGFHITEDKLVNPQPDTVSIYQLYQHWSGGEFAIRHHDHTGTKSIEYLKNNTNGESIDLVATETSFFRDGNYQHWRFDQPTTVYKSPMKFGDEFSAKYSTIDSILKPSPFPGVDTLVAHVHTENKFEADAYGKITLGDGTELEVLRIFETETSKDTADVYIPGSGWVPNVQNQLAKRYTYWYYCPGYGYPVAFVQMDQNNLSPVSMSILKRASLSNVEPVTSDDLIRIYPNPGDGNFSIDLPTKGVIQMVEIIDINGQIQSTHLNPGIKLHLSVTPGVYMARFHMNNGNHITKRLIISQ